MEGRRIYVKHPSYYADTLQHSGRKGMHWGERLYQYPDGSLTPLGRIHYGVGAARKAVSDHVKRERNEDGTLTLRGKIKYKTTDKYKLMTDDEIRKQTNRLNLQKNLEQLKKETSTSYRLKSKLEGVAEDAVVSGTKRAVEKVLNNLIDKKLGNLLNIDKNAIAESRKHIEGMTKKEISALIDKYNTEAKYIELTTGKKVPTGYKFMDLTEQEKEGLKRSEQQNNPNNQRQNKQQETPSKSENSQSSEKKSEEQKVPEEKKVSETKSSEKKSEEKKADKTKFGATVAVKRDKTPEKKSESKNDNSSGNEISASKISAMKAMKRQGQSIQQIAMVMKVSPSTVEKYLKG